MKVALIIIDNLSDKTIFLLSKYEKVDVLYREKNMFTVKLCKNEFIKATEVQVKLKLTLSVI